MCKVIWSPTALEDAEKNANYISLDSPERASLFVQTKINTSSNY
jgi:plasmid stabilization system protein ParE